jgi:hypothetical protein
MVCIPGVCITGAGNHMTRLTPVLVYKSFGDNVNCQGPNKLSGTLTIVEKRMQTLVKTHHHPKIRNTSYNQTVPIPHPSTSPQLFHIRSTTLSFSVLPKPGSSKSCTSSKNPSRKPECDERQVSAYVRR